LLALGQTRRGTCEATVLKGGLMCYEIYERASRELFPRTYRKLEDRDRIKVAQLFDKLLAKGHWIHVDELADLCTQAGYDETTAKDIGRLYDDLCLIRRELEDPDTIEYWPPERIEQIIGGKS
jgi:hypothetical protein